MACADAALMHTSELLRYTNGIQQPQRNSHRNIQNCVKPGHLSMPGELHSVRCFVSAQGRRFRSQRGTGRDHRRQAPGYDRICDEDRPHRTARTTLQAGPSISLGVVQGDPCAGWRSQPSPHARRPHAGRSRPTAGMSFRPPLPNYRADRPPGSPQIDPLIPGLSRERTQQRPQFVPASQRRVVGRR